MERLYSIADYKSIYLSYPLQKSDEYLKQRAEANKYSTLYYGRAVKSNRLLGMHDHPHILHFFVPSYRPGQKKDISNDLIIVVIISSILILLFPTSFRDWRYLLLLSFKN